MNTKVQDIRIESNQDVPEFVFLQNENARQIKSDEEAIQVANTLVERFKKNASYRDQNRLLPLEEIVEYSQSGLWGINIPKQYGGAQVKHRTLSQVIRTLASADPALTQISENHLSFLEQVRLDATEEQKKLIYQAVLNGQRLGNALSERGGRTVTDLTTRIIKNEKNYIVSGKKFYATGAILAHWVYVVGLDENGEELTALIPHYADGLSIINDWSGFGQRSTASGTVILDQIPVDAEYVIKTGAGGSSINLVGTISQLIHSSIDAGIAHAAIEDTIEFVQKYTRPWIDADQERAVDDQFTQAAIAELKIKLHAAEALLDRAGDFIDRALESLTEEKANAATLAVAEAKVLSAEIAILASNKLFELSGTRSALSELNLDRHWRNARIHTLHDPVRWKYKLIGEYYLTGKHLPRHPWS
ncbi:SfnB family sulfur acquisition oxidoreductase [Acinetobacter sp. ANC 4558]|uniref:SfnB family sulfur acquisition oxidoreductase n=1 Tax=Acinetobacter sp. ANC 4558 TaxID=1977876 RepID=UPI000A33CE3B|nr:SfnB family sulfur acquisition oxidoreductase [Acinetobacter sp. ANC 4558]OTG87006.1 SfnB family sulfur acquisition oxidoreductase [Acinetobacter sp. ANC 4558]